MRPGLKAREGGDTGHGEHGELPASMRPGLKAREGAVSGAAPKKGDNSFNEARA